MKNILYYFTGTGNSLVIARKIAEKLGDFEVIPITEALHAPLAEDVECVGVSFPIYAYRPPKMVVKFLQALRKARHGNYVFVIANCGGGPGNVLSHVKRILGNRRIHAGFTMRMPSNYLPFGTVPAPDQQQAIFGEAERKIDTIVEIVKARKRSFDPVTKFFRTYIHPGILYSALSPMMHSMDKNFWATDSCSGCGICSDVCPVQNIVLEGGKPVWGHACEQCWACVHWCPKAAIEYGKNTVNKERYHHPDVSLTDLKRQAAGV